ncbi:TRAM/LAG1/CLN8 homology domain-containing protein [Spinellus fusiger]|nr:TRAM/LAG1/CLN8 homology domain-containing protein [Spinellus fusiger]
MYHSEYWMNTSHFWINYPHIHISSLTKYYYLMQTAFWFQQVYVLHVEKRRKDHYAMLAHHIITITLLVSSYYTHFTRIGNSVLCCMDLADVFLSLAKILKYLGYSTLCDVVFGLFAVVWPVTRHGLFFLIIGSTAVHPPLYMDMKWDPLNGKYFTPLTQNIYLGLFLMLNLLMFYWFIMIVKVIVKVLQGKNAEDTRSDEEDSSEQEKR